MSAGQRIVFGALVLVVAYLVLVPIAALVLGSLRDQPPGFPGAFTLRNFAEVVHTPRTLVLLRQSFIFAATASLIAFALGTFLAWIVERTNTPGTNLIFLATVLPLYAPTVLLTLAWTLLLNPNSGAINVILKQLLGSTSPLFNIYSMGGMVWVRSLLDVPLAFLWMSPIFRTMDVQYEEAAHICGASRTRVFLDITLPLATPAVVATLLITFVAAIEDLAVPLFIGIPGKAFVLSSEIFLATMSVPSNINVASAYGIILLLVTIAAMSLYLRLTAHSERFVTVTGKGYRAKQTDLGLFKYATLAGAVVLLFVVALVPTLILLWTAFVPFSQIPTLGGLTKLTIKNFFDLLQLSMTRRALMDSALLGVSTGILVMIMTALIAWLLTRTRTKGRNLIDSLATLPLAVPGIVVGVGLLWVYLPLRIPIYATLWILLIAYVTRFIPYGLRILKPAFNQLHPELEEAAQVAGASWGRVFRSVSLPLILPAILSGLIFVFVRAFRELPSSMFLTHLRTEVFSVTLYNMWQSGQVEMAAALGVLSLVILGGVTLFVRILVPRW